MNQLENNETKIFVSLLRNIVKKQGHPLWKIELKKIKLQKTHHQDNW